MGGARILNDRQIDQMAEYRERGWSCARIAAWFTEHGTKISESSIAWQCLRVGADLPPHRRQPSPRIVAHVRNGFPVKPFTAEEDQRLLDLEATGATWAQMCRALGRRNNSLRARLMILARLQARAEEAGEA